ncbi:transposase [Sphaerisporangium sp. NBC_01403]|uniref:transposase n=1 Tax=Sphaerisporangium sp. NBC_01403 TaxID=2903599 RepID=UPI003253D2AF
MRRRDGQELVTTVRALINHPDCSPSTNAAALPAINRGRQPSGLQDLTDRQRELVAMRYAHLMEAETGYRSGERLRRLSGEPRPAYDPETTTLTQRREAKVTELRALPAEEARMLGLERVSVRSLKRWAANTRRYGVSGCISGNWLRRSGGRPTITQEIREAIFAVRQETLHRSRISMKAKEGLIHQYVEEKFGPDTPVPTYVTLWRVWREWFGPGGTRQKYARSAARLEGTGGHVVVHRPGQVVALDTTEMAVMVRDTLFGEPTPVHLTLALDIYTHSIVAFRLTLVSDTSTDVAMLLRDVMMPLPLRDGWGEDMEWPYPGVPAALVAEFAGHKVAALPFFAPETITTDHGSVYKNHHLVDVQRVIGANILPARVLRPTDKHAVERAFGAVQSLLFEYLLGYRGVDVADRGQDPEADAVLTIAEMEHLIATWIVKIWQNRELGEYAPDWDPGGKHSPNTLFAAAMSQGGFSLNIPTPELYYELLRTHAVAIHGRRGVKIKGLWYDGDALNPYRDGPSSRGGKNKGKWVVRSDPRDRRFTYFQDPRTHHWHTLRWTGLPPAEEIPAFGDTRAHELLRAAKAAGLKPKSDAELLPLLLDLIGGHIPVTSWPTQMPKRKRKDHAREVLQGQAATADRPAAAAVSPPEPGEGMVVPLRQPQVWRQRAGDVASAVDDERRRRRQEAVPAQPGIPGSMSSSRRRRSIFAFPHDDDTTTQEGE